MPALEPYRATSDTWVIPSYLNVPGIGLIVINSYLIEAEEPVVIDTGMPVVHHEFLESLWSLIDPNLVRWEKTQRRTPLLLGAASSILR